MKNELNQKTRRDNERASTKRSVGVSASPSPAGDPHGEKGSMTNDAHRSSLRQLADDRLRHFALFR